MTGADSQKPYFSEDKPKDGNEYESGGEKRSEKEQAIDSKSGGVMFGNKQKAIMAGMIILILIGIYLYSQN